MTQLVETAVAEIALDEAEAVFERLCAHLDEHVDIRRDGWRAEARTPYVAVGFSTSPRSLRVEARAVDADYLDAVKTMVASHVAEFSGVAVAEGAWLAGIPAGPRPAEAPRRGRSYREMRVVAVHDLTPRMRRLTLSGDDLAPFADGGLHVRLVLPADGSAPPVPRVDAGGRLAFAEGVTPPPVRVYTIRRIDVAAGTVEIDFVLHGDDDGTPGSGFARTAAPGARLGMFGPGGRTVPEAARYVLAGDETALPMIARVLEALPATASAVVRIEAADAADVIALESAARLDVAWLFRGPGHPEAARPPGEALAEAVAAMPLDAADDGLFVLFAAESAAARTIRHHLRHTVGLASDRYIAAGFWDA